MGIVKIRHRGASSRNDGERASLGRKDSLDEFDDSDLADMGCELAMVGDQLCSIPYDLYNLSDLRGVLSLETWNSCLTEDERMHLAAYLPDMDHDVFLLTLNELLNGVSLFFGSPLDDYLHRLRGGFYAPQVTPLREGLQLLERRRHCHSLRVYHESLNRKFADMKDAWSGCTPSTTVEERITIWNNRRNRKPVLLVDLNAIPTEDDALNKTDKRVDEFPLLKKAKHVDEGVRLHTPPIDLKRVAVNPKPKGKGVLKVRSVGANTQLDKRLQSLASKHAPRGVLKIKPRVDHFGHLETQVAVTIPSAQSSIGVHLAKFSPSFQREDGDAHKLKYLHPTDGNSAAKLKLEQSEFLNLGVESLTNSRRSRMRSNEAGEFGSCYNGGRPWANSSLTSSESDLFRSPSQRKLSPVADCEYPPMPRRNYCADRGFSTVMDSSPVPGRGLILPITYRRKKAIARLGPTESLLQSPIGMDVDSVVSNNADSALTAKAKAPKIKLKGWNNSKVEYK